LVRVDRVLDRELVQVELAADGIELLLGRLVKADPDEGIPLLARRARLQHSQLAGTATAVVVDGAVDDHGRSIARPRPPVSAGYWLSGCRRNQPNFFQI
jgi:hypothetical protein